MVLQTSVNEKLEQRVEDTQPLGLRWSRTLSGKASGLAESEVDTETRRDVKKFTCKKTEFKGKKENQIMLKAKKDLSN